MSYTHGHAESVLRAHGVRRAADSAAYLLGHLRSGMSVLDVGCGPGTITLDLAARVAPAQVIGVDRAQAAIDRAREHRAEAVAGGHSGNVEFEVADLMALPYEDDTFDVVHAHQVLQHLPDPVGALREMRRVTRTGGLVAVRDVDYATMTWTPASAGLTEWLELYHEVARAVGGEPDAGRHLLGWALEAGFAAKDLTATASAWSYALDDAAWWAQVWAERAVSSGFASHAKEHGLADDVALEHVAEGWRSWGKQPAAWFAMLHGEVVATVS